MEHLRYLELWARPQISDDNWRRRTAKRRWWMRLRWWRR